MDIVHVFPGEASCLPQLHVCGCCAISKAPRPGVGYTRVPAPSWQRSLVITVSMHISFGSSLLLDLSVVRIRNFIFKKNNNNEFQM